MHPKKLKNIINLSHQERYDYFIREVVKLEYLWGISTPDNWIMFEDREKDIIFPLWPHKEVAEVCVFEELKGPNWKVESVSLANFLNFCIPEMIDEGVVFGIFYNLSRSGLAFTPEKLRNDIKAEIEEYL